MPVASPGSGNGKRREKPEASGVESAAYGIWLLNREGRKRKRRREKDQGKEGARDGLRAGICRSGAMEPVG